MCDLCKCSGFHLFVSRSPLLFMTQEMDEIETKHFQTRGLKYFHLHFPAFCNLHDPYGFPTENIPGNGGEKSDLVITEWVDQPRRIFQILKLKRKSSDWFSLLTYFMENFMKSSIHWIFAQKNGLFLCSKHCQKVLIKYSWIFPMVDNFLQKADRQLQSYSQKLFHNFSPQTGFNQTPDC